MKVDAGSVYGFAAVSLLTAACECTAPTELEEIEKRAKDMLALLGEVEVISATESMFPAFPLDKWPFATKYNDLMPAANAFSCSYPTDNEAKEAFLDTTAALLKCDAIEQKYRLSKVKKDVMRQMLLPF